MVLPAVLDPWAASALYEAANLAAKNPGSKLWLVSLGPKAKLQQVMMTVAQKVAFELVPIDGPIGGFPDAHSTAAASPTPSTPSPDSTAAKLLALRRMGVGHRAARASRCSSSASGSASPTSSRASTRSICATTAPSKCWSASKAASTRSRSARARPPCSAGPRATCAEPRNNPQVGMANMRTIMPALQKAKAAALDANGLSYVSVSLPKQQRETRVEKNMSADEIARELVGWIGAE